MSTGGVGRLWPVPLIQQQAPWSPCYGGVSAVLLRAVPQQGAAAAAAVGMVMAVDCRLRLFQLVGQSCESQAGSDYHRSAHSSRSAQPAKLKQQPTNFKLTLRIPTPISDRKARLGAVLSLPGREERTGTPAARPMILLDQQIHLIQLTGPAV